MQILRGHCGLHPLLVSSPAPPAPPPTCVVPGEHLSLSFAGPFTSLLVLQLFTSTESYTVWSLETGAHPASVFFWFSKNPSAIGQVNILFKKKTYTHTHIHTCTHTHSSRRQSRERRLRSRLWRQADQRASLPQPAAREEREQMPQLIS